MIYHVIADPLDEDGRLKFDALLGDKGAQRKVDERRVEAVVEGGFEVG